MAKQETKERYLRTLIFDCMTRAHRTLMTFIEGAPQGLTADDASRRETLEMALALLSTADAYQSQLERLTSGNGDG